MCVCVCVFSYVYIAQSSFALFFYARGQSVVYTGDFNATAEYIAISRYMFIYIYIFFFSSSLHPFLLLSFSLSISLNVTNHTPTESSSYVTRRLNI